MKRRNIVLFGAYCYRNIGDDLFFYVLESFFKKKYGGENLGMTLLTANPEQKYETERDVSYIHSKNIFGVIRALFYADTVVIGPGSVFTSLSLFWKQNVYILFLVTVSKLFRKKCIFLGIDFVEIDSWTLRNIAFLSLFLSDTIYVRFPENYEYLRKYRFIRNKLTCISDLVYSHYFLDFIDYTHSQQVQKGKVTLILSDLGFFKNYASFERYIVDILTILLKHSLQISVISLNMSHIGNKDYDYFLRLNEKYNLRFDSSQIHQYDLWNQQNIKEVCGLLQKSHIVISNKLHSSIISSIFGLKILSLSYHNKMRQLNNQIGLEDIYDFNIEKISDENYDEYIERFERVLKNLLSNDKTQYNTDEVALMIQKNDDFLESFTF